jgi:hypothetical protein
MKVTRRSAAELEALPVHQREHAPSEVFELVPGVPQSARPASHLSPSYCLVPAAPDECGIEPVIGG